MHRRASERPSAEPPEPPQLSKFRRPKEQGRPDECSDGSTAAAAFTGDASLIEQPDEALAAARKVREHDFLMAKYGGGGKLWVKVLTLVASEASIVAGCEFCDGSGTTTLRLWTQNGKPDWYEKPSKAPPLMAASGKLSACFAYDWHASYSGSHEFHAELMSWPTSRDFGKSGSSSSSTSPEPFTPFHYLFGRDAFRPPISETLAPSEKWIDALPFENSVFAGSVNFSIPKAGDVLTVRKKLTASGASSGSEIGHLVLAVISPFDMDKVDLASSDALGPDACIDLGMYCLLTQRFALKGHGAAKAVQLVDHRNQTLAPGELQPEVLQHGLRSEEWHLISVSGSLGLTELLGEAVVRRVSQGMRDHCIFAGLFSDDVQEMEGALSGAVFDWLSSTELLAQRCGGRDAMIQQIIETGLASRSAVLAKPLASSLKPTSKQVEAALAEYTKDFNCFIATLIRIPQLYQCDNNAEGGVAARSSTKSAGDGSEREKRTLHPCTLAPHPHPQALSTSC